MTEQQIVKCLINDGYNLVRLMPGRGFCGIRKRTNTWGLYYGLTPGVCTDYKGCYCYEGFHEAVLDYVYWNGETDPPGDWISDLTKDGDRFNPYLITKTQSNGNP